MWRNYSRIWTSCVAMLSEAHCKESNILELSKPVRVLSAQLPIGLRTRPRNPEGSLARDTHWASQNESGPCKCGGQLLGSKEPKTRAVLGKFSLSIPTPALFSLSIPTPAMIAGSKENWPQLNPQPRSS